MLTCNGVLELQARIYTNDKNYCHGKLNYSSITNLALISHQFNIQMHPSHSLYYLLFSLWQNASQNQLQEGEVTLACGLRVQSIMEGKTW